MVRERVIWKGNKARRHLSLPAVQSHLLQHTSQCPDSSPYHSDCVNYCDRLDGVNYCDRLDGHVRMMGEKSREMSGLGSKGREGKGREEKMDGLLLVASAATRWRHQSGCQVTATFCFTQFSHHSRRKSDLIVSN